MDVRNGNVSEVTLDPEDIIQPVMNYTWSIRPPLPPPRLNNCCVSFPSGDDPLTVTPSLMRYDLHMTVMLLTAYTFVFLIGVVGNCFVVAVVYRSPRMRSATNLFIVNLALADLLVNVLCLPFTLISNIINAWILGWVICKTVPYLQGVSVSASVNTLVAISVERCLAICYPMKWQITSRGCRLILLLIWLYSISITLPWALYFRLQPMYPGADLEVCTEAWPTPEGGKVYFIVANLLMCYLLPLAIITVCYLFIWLRVWRRRLPGETRDHSMQQLVHRSKVKVVKMLLVVVVLFALSWLPLYVIFTRVKFGTTPSEREDLVIRTVAPVAQWLGASNSCINPILYAFFNKKFRTGFKAVLTSKSCCAPLRYELGPKHQSTLCSSAASARSTRSIMGSKQSSFLSNISFQQPSSSSGCASVRHSPTFAALKRYGGLDPSSAKTANKSVVYRSHQCISNGVSNGNMTPL